MRRSSPTSIVARRHGRVWHVLFYLATTIAIFALIILLLNIFNSVFGFVLVENEVAPTELVASGELRDLSREELIALLEEYLSAGLIRRFNFEEPLAERSVADLAILVQERIVNPTIVEAWSLRDSLFNQELIRAAHAESPRAPSSFAAGSTRTSSLLPRIHDLSLRGFGPPSLVRSG
jgi:hypothetical protein